MLYCELCRAKNDWPESDYHQPGTCARCGFRGPCWTFQHMQEIVRAYDRFGDSEELVQPSVVAKWIGVWPSSICRWVTKEVDTPKAIRVLKGNGSFTPVWRASQELEWKEWYSKRMGPDEETRDILL